MNHPRPDREGGSPTVASLCGDLPHDLVPVEPEVPPSVPVSAVHISELPDPTPYLEGGELLLTTGLTLPGSVIGCRRYTERVVQAGVSALALGLGPVHEAVPPRLLRACREAGLCLLKVPAPTPFLTISRAYWAAVARADQEQLTAALSAHRGLVAAAVSGRPVPGVLRALATAVSGWAAHLDRHGRVDEVWPSDRYEVARQVQDETQRLRVAGLRSAATFPVGPDNVVVHPLAAGNRAVGYLATGTRSAVTATHRHVILTACALLSLDAAQARQRRSAALASRSAVAHLLDLGDVTAARQLAERLGIADPPPLVRVLVAASDHPDRTLDVVHQTWANRDVFGAVAADTVWCAVPDAPDLADALHALAEAVHDEEPRARALLGPPTEVEKLPETRTVLQHELRAVPTGEVVERTASPAPETLRLDPVGARALLAPVLDCPTDDVRTALAAYLRHRGSWEAAARELRFHRNTLRYRIRRARQLLALDIDDPDVSAVLWLSLRELGYA